ncbi:hypothetical protein [Natrinema gelatinilyticum]|uniref:hypothetical protein n=1 Tax=Natrinema gelatinilyticum TaxID=2961571 RepID=UPI0020C48B1F|nr:hypothetical protein [Natrinema gelatinilyticum]
METREIDDPADTVPADWFDSTFDQPDLQMYLPGTPTVNFVEYVELATKLLLGR